MVNFLGRHFCSGLTSSLAAVVMLGIAFAARDIQAADAYPPWKLGLSSQSVSVGSEFIPRGADGRNNTAAKLNFRPAASNYAGLILGYRWLSGTVSFAVPASGEVRLREGVSRYRDYRLAYYTKRLGLEASYNRFSSYIIENSSVLSANTRNNQEYYKLPSMETLGFGATVLWSFSEKSKYSIAAALDQSELQKESDGSLIGILTLRDQRITNGGQALIPVEKQSDFGNDKLISRLETITAAVGPGYGAQWVPGDFFVSALLALSIGWQNIRYSDTAGSTQSGSTTVVNSHLRVSLGVNSRVFFATIAAYVDRYSQILSAMEVGNSVSGVTLSLGVRF